MTISNQKSIRTLVVTTCGALYAFSSAHADVIDLVHSDTLTGTISALSSEGATITSPLTPKPIKIKADKIKKITFETPASDTHQHTEQVILTNGDILPCRVLSMDENTLHLTTWYAGALDIPRQNIRSLQFGISENALIYQATDDPSEWTTRKGNWSFDPDKNGYSCQGAGSLARPLELSKNLHINFDIAWESTPNFSFRFCADNDKARTKQNAYEFSLNSAGIKLRRVLKTQAPSPLTNINRKPHEIKKQTINVDILVNRDLGEITLHLDGQMVGTWPDSAETAEGNFIILNNGSNQNSSCYVNNLVVNNWLNGLLPRHQQTLSPGKEDIMIDSEGEVISGHITAISQAKKNNRVINLQLQHSKPINAPEHRVSNLIFAKKDLSSATPTASSSLLQAQLTGGGVLHLESPLLDKGKITLQHSILGTITLDTSAVSSIISNPAP